jgi:hypothetical protein
MPGLLDLPPELIEQIHLAHEQLVVAEHEDHVGVAEDLGHSRLTCRYIERATRRAFVETHFFAWFMKAPDDADIQKFCAMTRTPDLAAAIQELYLHVDDDYTMEVQETESLDHLGNHDLATSLQGLSLTPDHTLSEQVTERGDLRPPNPKVTHACDNITGALVPAAYLRHRVALVAAFRACKNITYLYIGNKPLEPERAEHYKRASRLGEIEALTEDSDVSSRMHRIHPETQGRPENVGARLH